MNKHNAKDYLPLVQALAEGKDIQWDAAPSRGVWGPVEELNFNYPASRYRIKPEPRKAWVWWPEEGCRPVICETHEEAVSWVNGSGGHITEVTE